MIATFVVEILMACAAFVHLKLKNSRQKLGVSLIVLLALFQAIEFLVCKGIGPIETLSRIGFIIITLMPPMGLHLGHALSKKIPLWLRAGADISAVGLATYFLTHSHIFNTIICGKNYAIIRLHEPINLIYTTYYYVFLLAGVVYLTQSARLTRNALAKSQLIWLTIGYLTFMIPTGVFIFLRPEAYVGIPSIMCGFAVMLAAIIYFKILPDK